MPNKNNIISVLDHGLISGYNIIAQPLKYEQTNYTNCILLNFYKGFTNC